MLKDDLAKLLKLQEIDSRIFDQEEEAGGIPEKLKERQDALKLKQDALHAIKKKAEDAAKEKKLLELDVDSKNQQIKKLNNQLNEVKTNKEYSALQQEITHAKEDVLKAEEAIIEKLMLDDDIKLKLAKGAEEVKAEEAKLKAEEEKLKAEGKQLEEALKTEKTEREALAAGVEDKKLLARYEQIRANAGNGVAAIVIVNNSCGGCGTMLRPQETIEIHKFTHVVECEDCGKIFCG